MMRPAACIGLVALLLLPTVSAAEETPLQAWIVSGALVPLPQVQAVVAQGASAYHSYENLDMVAFTAPANVALEIQSAVGGRLDPNEMFQLHLDRSVPAIEADRVKDALGVQRNGPTALVVDTGVDSNHPDFQAGNLVANVQAKREGTLVTGVVTPDAVVDKVGHGTHIAGIIAGSGEGLGTDDPVHGQYQGVYSNGRVASFQADVSTTPNEEPHVDTLAVLESMDWAIENRDLYDIRTTSFSWGRTGTFNADHPLNQATLRLYLDGIVVIFSAGNLGQQGAGTLNQHCVAPWVLCVAAADESSVRMPYSSYGDVPDESRPWDHPDLAAPGHKITSADPVASAEFLGGLPDLGGLIASAETPTESLYRDRSGTSMAAPHVVGVASLIQAANPELSPDQVMDILTETATPMADSVERVGAGFVNAREAYNLALQTVGSRDAFLAGAAVKYAGIRSGDPEFARDAVSHGFNAPLVSSDLILRDPQAIWFLQTPTAWILLGLAAVMVLVGVDLRKRPRHDAPGGAVGGDIAGDGKGEEGPADELVPDVRP